MWKIARRIVVALFFFAFSPSFASGVDAAPSAGRLFSEKWIADRSKNLRILAESGTNHVYASVPRQSGGVAALYYSFPIQAGDGCRASEADLLAIINVAAAIIPYYSKGSWRPTTTYPQPEMIILVHGAEAHSYDAERARCDAAVAEELASIPAYMQTEMYIGQPIDLYTWKQFIPPLRIDVEYGFAVGQASASREQSWQMNPGAATPRLHKVLAGALDGLAPVVEGESGPSSNRRVEVWVGNDANDLAALIRRSSALDADFSEIQTLCTFPSTLGYCVDEKSQPQGRLDRLPIAKLIFQPNVTTRSEIGKFVMGQKYARDD